MICPWLYTVFPLFLLGFKGPQDGNRVHHEEFADIVDDDPEILQEDLGAFGILVGYI